jgi:hypothetical protein
MPDMKRSYRVIERWLKLFAIFATGIPTLFLVTEIFSAQEHISQTDRIFVLLFIPSAWILYFGARAWFVFLTKIAR